MNDIEQRIAASITRNPNKPNYAIAKNFKNVHAGFVAAVRLKMDLPLRTEPAAPPAPPTGSGITLRGMRVLSRRPAESAAKFIKRLPKGRGFDPKDLARDWGMSEETIRRHARDMSCLKFVEVSEDEWVPLIMNPETAQDYTL